MSAFNAKSVLGIFCRIWPEACWSLWKLLLSLTGLWTDSQSCFPQCEADWLRCTMIVDFSKLSTKLRHTEWERNSIQERSTYLSYIFQQNKSKHLSRHTGLSLQSSKHSLRWWKLLPLVDLFGEPSTVSVKSQGLVRREVFFFYSFSSGHQWLCFAFLCSGSLSSVLQAGKETDWSMQAQTFSVGLWHSMNML